MASNPGNPDAPPESIIISNFGGIKNTVSAERLKPGELERAINIDIDDDGQIRRRRGQTLKLAGDCHSLYRGVIPRTLVVKDGSLGLLNTNYAFTPIVAVGAQHLAYAEVGETVFYSSPIASGKILSDNSAAPWGTQGADTWLSPVVNPTPTLGAIRGKLLGAPRNATALTAWNGRIYMADGNTLWATELYLFDYVDKTKSYIQFESDITVLAAVDDGLYVGTEDALHFLTGSFSQGLVRKTVSQSPVVRGSDVAVDAAQMTAGQNPPGATGLGIMLLAQNGVLACYAGGIVTNTTLGRTVFPGADDAAALHRDDAGVSSYLTVTRSGGGPTTNARIGDFVDAEVRRATGS